MAVFEGVVFIGPGKKTTERSSESQPKKSIWGSNVLRIPNEQKIAKHCLKIRVPEVLASLFAGSNS
jgi:hypothetical protein